MEAAVLLSSVLDANALAAPDHLESCGRCLLEVVAALGRCPGLTPTAVANLLAPFDCCELCSHRINIGSLFMLAIEGETALRCRFCTAWEGILPMLKMTSPFAKVQSWTAAQSVQNNLLIRFQMSSLQSLRGVVVGRPLCKSGAGKSWQGDRTAAACSSCLGAPVFCTHQQVHTLLLALKMPSSRLLLACEQIQVVALNPIRFAGVRVLSPRAVHKT